MELEEHRNKNLRLLCRELVAWFDLDENRTDCYSNEATLLYDGVVSKG